MSPRRRPTQRAANWLDDKTRELCRREIISRYAKLQTNGNVIMCRTVEALGRPPKVIFPSEAAALRCADELRVAGFGRQHAYSCPWSKSGHYHLTSSAKRRWS